jgi:YbbR domain-containing protein
VPATTTPRSQSSLKRRLTAAFTERFVLKVTAILFALVLWVVVNAKEPQIELVGVRFMPALLDSSLVLRDSLPQFQALIAGSPKELIKLNSAPLTIRRQITADAPDTLVVDLRPEDVVLPSGVDAVVRDLQPRSVTLRFEPSATRRVPIGPSAIEITTLFPIAMSVRPQFDPETVQISGPRRLILGIKSVKTVRTTIAFPDSLAHLVDIDVAALGDGVRVRPAQVKVHVTADPRRG